ncbi:hypothetical protein ACQKQD_17280 [Methylobacterium sp. NPDC080182]|uniref:hypothetical protein n=1 Tax=Methylobacterium sp. NPDC080182 TaxID=3390590 RepID=UPI003D032D84
MGRPAQRDWVGDPVCPEKARPSHTSTMCSILGLLIRFPAECFGLRSLFRHRERSEATQGCARDPSVALLDRFAALAMTAPI